jgi:hypothetical protein
MTDEIALQRAVDRAARARTLVEDELLREAFTSLKSRYLEAWEQSNLRDTEGRERLFQAVHIIGSVQSHLNTILSNGSIAKAEIDAMIGATGEISVV